MNDKILSFLGLCRRAGKLIVGAEPSIESINKHKAKLIIFAKDFSKIVSCFGAFFLTDPKKGPAKPVPPWDSIT